MLLYHHEGVLTFINPCVHLFLGSAVQKTTEPTTWTHEMEMPFMRGQHMLSMNFLEIWIYIRVVTWDEGFGCRTITVFFTNAIKSLNDVSHHKRHKNVHCHSCNRQRRVVVHLGWRVTAWQNNGKHLRNLMHVADQNTLTFRGRTYILKSLRALLQKDTQFSMLHPNVNVNVGCCIPISVGFRCTTQGTCVWNISIYEF